MIRDFLLDLAGSKSRPVKGEESYDEHYKRLRAVTDTRSELERRFLDHLYRTRRRLPDHTQYRIENPPAEPDFFYEPNVCVFCDGAVHDEPEQRRKDLQVRGRLRAHGYRVIVIRYDKDLEEQIRQHPDVFGEPQGESEEK